MATNRFNPRSPVVDLAQRQAQAQGRPPPNRNTREQRRAENPITPTGRNSRVIPQGITMTIGDWATQTINWGDVGTFTTTNLDRAFLTEQLNNVNNNWQQDAAEIRRRTDELRQELFRTTQNVNRPFRMPTADPLEVRHTDWTQQAERQLQRNEQRRAFRSATASRIKSKTYQQRYRNVMAFGVPYRGSAFEYRLNYSEGIGIWSVSGIDVAHICLVKVRLKKIFYPEPIVNNRTDDTTNRALYNRTRFLWRQLGIKAIRYKDKAVVHTGRSGAVLKPGEAWDIKEEYIDSYIGSSNPTLTQADLFTGLFIPSKHDQKTKPVEFVNLKGTRFTMNAVLLKNGTYFPLNNPPANEVTEV